MPLYLKEEKRNTFNKKYIFIVLGIILLLMVGFMLVYYLPIDIKLIYKISLIVLVCISIMILYLTIRHYRKKVLLHKRKIQTLEEEIRRLRQTSN